MVDFQVSVRLKMATPMFYQITFIIGPQWTECANTHMHLCYLLLTPTSPNHPQPPTSLVRAENIAVRYATTKMCVYPDMPPYIIHTYIYRCVYICVYVYMHNTYILMYMHTYIYIHTCTHIQTYIHVTCTHICRHVCTCV